MSLTDSFAHIVTQPDAKAQPRISALSVPNTGTLFTMVEPITHLSVPDQVFARLREAILSGAYGPGERLPPQRALAGEFDVNMASIREAIARLEQLRLVDVRHGDGTRVLDWRRSGGLEALVLAGPERAPVLRDLFEARGLLLVEAARLAAERRSDEQAAMLHSLAAAVAGASGEQTALLADWSFMEALVEGAGNVAFQLIMNSVRELYLPHLAAFAALVSDRATLAGHYARAAEAIDAHDGSAAALAIGELAAAQQAWMLS